MFADVLDKHKKGCLSTSSRKDVQKRGSEFYTDKVLTSKTWHGNSYYNFVNNRDTVFALKAAHASLFCCCGLFFLKEALLLQARAQILFLDVRDKKRERETETPNQKQCLCVIEQGNQMLQSVCAFGESSLLEVCTKKKPCPKKKLFCT